MSDESVEQFETELLELAVRRVATPEGSQFYGLPIGAPITADVIATKKAEAAAAGLTPPKGGLSKGGSGSKGKFMAGTISGKAAAEKGAPKPQAPKPLNLKIKKSELKGNQHFSVGSSKYVAPNGSKLIRPKSQPGMAYVVTPEGDVHAFNEAGEIDIPKPLDQIFAKKFGEGFEGDDEYDIEDFEAASASHALPDLKVGSILTDSEGTPQFKKLAEDSWEHVDLGVKLKDQDLQELYDSGDLVPDKTDEDNQAAENAFQDTEAMNFSEMSMQEAQQALLDLPVGRKLTVGDKTWEKTTSDQFTDEEGKAATPVSLAYVKNQIKIGTDVKPDYNPLDGETSNPLDENPPKLIGDTPDEAWITNAKPGAQMEFTADSGTKTIWTKDEEGTGWTNQKGGKLSQEALLNAHKNSGGKGLAIKKEGKQPKTSAGGSGKGNGVSQAGGIKNGSEDGSAEGNSVPAGSGGVAEEPSAGSGGLDGSGHPGGDGSGVQLADGHTPALLNGGKKLEESERTKELKSQGLPVADLYELDSSKEAGTFHAAISKLKENNPYAASVYVYPEDEYKDMRLFLNSDGSAGVALHGDEIVSVFVHADSKDKGSAQSLIAQAVANGGKRLDAFDTVLPKIYAKEGFVPVARTHWDDNFAPEGWDKKLFEKYNGGEPDVVFMAYDQNAVGSTYDPSEGALVASYDKGVEKAKNWSPGQKTAEQIVADPQDQDKLWFEGDQIVYDANYGMWSGSDEDGGFSLGDGEVKKFVAEGKVTLNQQDYVPSVDELGPKTTEAKTLNILASAETGSTVHPVDSDATLTKLDSRADEVVQKFGTDASDPAGYWQSSITGHVLTGSELAQVWHGDLKAGPGANPDKPVLAMDEKIQNIDAATSLQEMNDWLSAANPGVKVSSLTAVGMEYQKLNNGKFKHVGSGIEQTPMEVAQGHWNSEMGMSELKYDGHEDLAPEVPQAEGSALPANVPSDATQFDPKSHPDFSEGDTIYEVTQMGQVLTSVKQSDNSYAVTLPDGLEMTSSEKEVFDMSPETNKFYVSKAKTPGVSEDPVTIESTLDLPEGARESGFDGAAMSAGDIVYGVETDGSVYSFQLDEYGDFITNGPGEENSTTGYSDLMDMADSGAMTFYSVPKADTPAAPKMEMAWQVGDKLTTPEDFDQVPVNTKLAYLQKSGKISYYATLGNGMVLTPGGNQMAVSKMSWAIGQGNVSIHELPGGEPTPNDVPQFLFSDGDKITDLQQINAMAVGQKLEMVGADGKHLNFIIKGEDGTWAAPDDDPNWPGLQFYPSDLVDAMKTKGGGVFYVQTEGVDNLTPGNISFETPVVQKPELEIGGTVLFEDQLKQALDGLEAHSSFHVAYGLKSLPDDHPLTDPQLQTELKNMAMDAHPDLKAKPAVVQFLKDKLGIKDPEPNWEDALMEAAPKIHLGSLTPKKVGVQGMDGGDYTATDIQDAINILEAYPGKLFKNELNKKGNPLGELDPTQLVGFDKDKLATKQKYIDLLKTKLVVQEEQTKHPTVKDMDEFKGYPVGTSVRENVNGTDFNVWTKISQNQWHLDSGPSIGDKDIIAIENDFDISVKKGDIKLDKLPDVVPDYAKTPAAVKDKEKQQFDVNDPNFSLQTMKDAEIGTKMHWGDGNNNRAEKTADDEWTIFDADGNKINSWTDQKFFDGISMGKGWQFDDVNNDVPTFNANQEFAIIPGKYSTDKGKAFMVVHADGSGTHYSPSGAQVALTPEKVKKNYDAGMKQYGGLVNESDLPVAKTPSKATKKAPTKKPATVADLADGTFFGGDPSDPKSSIYEVSGDKVKVFKAAQGLTASTGVKIGGPPTKQWAEEAGFGASFENPSTYYMGSWVGNTTWTKGKDGKWSGLKADGTVLEPASDGQPPVGWGYKVTSHGMSDPVDLPKSKVNTLFAKGQLTDQYGNAVLPEGYTGTTMFFGSKTTVPALVAAQKWLSGPEGESLASSNEMISKLKELGVFWDTDNWKKWRIANGLTEPDFEGSKVAMQKALDDAIVGVDTDIPESDASSLFQWNDLGQAVMPLEIAAKPVPYGKVERGEWIKEASKAIGDGKVIGLHLAKMDQWDRGAWIDAFQKGDFAKMYQLEVAAAALEGKAHGAGYLHPGFSGNKETNKIAWAAAVDGEISALDDVPGEWTSQGITASMEEVDNYLIKAQMQNPTYLNATEKRTWYNEHRKGNKGVVDALSAAAALRKKNGEAEQSPAPKWSDDLKPAKSYDTLFESDALPVLGWTSSKGLDYVNDNPDNAELQSMFKAKQDEGYGEMGAANSVVSAYFQKLKDEHEAELAKVFYQKSPNQKVKKGTHPIYEYDDFNGHGPVGNHYFFKPSPQGDAYRSEVEHLGHEFGWAFGFKTAGSELTTLDGKYGQLQKDLGAVGDLVNFDMSTLTAKQIADIGKEHLLDWFLDNDDTHHENIKILPDGSLVGIDKGRAFKHFGKWQGLDPDSMNTNTNTVYSKLFNAVKSGKLSKEDVDKAYLQIQKRAQMMAKVSDEKISDMLAKGMEKRKIWDVSYKIDGKNVPNNLQGLTAAVLDRKNKLPQQIEEMWSKIYKDAGYGDLPEPSVSDIEGVTTGLMHEDFHAQAIKAKAAGKTTMISGAHIIGGTALMWTEKESDGTDVAMGEMYMGPKKQKELLSFFTTNAVASPDAAGPAYQFNYDTFGTDIVSAAKTINHHAVDGEYNQTKIDAYEAAKAKIEADSAEWTANLTSNTQVGGTEAYKFKSGSVVAMDQLDQYKLMLDYYAPILDKIQVAKDSKGKTGIVDAYTPVEFVKPPQKFAMADGSTLLGKGDSFLYKDASTGTVSKVDSSNQVVKDALDGKGGWSELATSEAEKPDSGVKIVKNSKTFETQASYDPATGVKKKFTSTVDSGAKGQEFEIQLPTGESIFWRNASHTSTATGQQGKLSYKIPNADSPEAIAASMERIQEQLNQLGITTEPSSHEQAELTYWREMYGVLENRNHSAPGSKLHAQAYAKMNEKVKEIGGDPHEFLENLSEKLDPEEEIAYWRDLYSQFWPKQVQELIETEGYLPKFDHQNLWDAEQETGKPYWMRFDVSTDDILATGAVLAHSTGGEPDANGAMSSGGLVGGEERIRQFGKIYTGGGYGSGSPLQDQGNGSSHQIYTRIQSASHVGANVVINPATLLRTRTYSLGSDSYGNLGSRKGSSPANPLDSVKKFMNGGGNETMIPHVATILDTIELLGFSSVMSRDAFIQKLKKLGITQIRGVNIEDRFVMQKDMKQAIEKIQKTWSKK